MKRPPTKRTGRPSRPGTKSKAKAATGKAGDGTPSGLLAALEQQRELLEIQNEELGKAYAALEISHKRFAEMHEQAPVGYLTFDAQGCIRAINAEAVRLLGVVRRTILGKPFVVYVEKEDRRKFLQHLWKIRRSDARGAIDLRLAGVNGTVRQVRMTTNRHHSSKGRSLLFLSTIEDVTELRTVSANAAYLASIVESARDAMIACSPEGLITSWNRAAEALFGYRRDEVLGRHTSILAPEDRQGELTRILKTALSGMPVPPFETVRQRKDGTLVDVEVSLFPILESGNVVAATAVLRDITERKASAEKLKKKAELLSLAQDAGRMGIFEWDLATGRAYWTPEMEELMGMKLGDGADNLAPWFARIHPEDQVRFERLVAEWLDSERQDVTQQYRFCRNGEERWIEARGRVLRDAAGNALKMIGTNLDITDRKRAESRLRESEERFRGILENSLDAAYRRNLQTNSYDYISPVIERMTGYTPEEMNSKPLNTVLKHMHPADVRHVRRAIREAIKTGEPCRRLEYRFQCKDGSYRWMAEAFRIIPDAAGRPLHLVGIVRDVSEMKQVEEALRESQRLARSTVEAIPAKIAVIDETGMIIETNKAWRRFSQHNGGSEEETGTGANYLDVCDHVRGMDRRDAARFAAGIRAVSSGRKRMFSMEYPCHSPTEKRWFTGYVTPFAGAGERRMVVAHVDITAVKLAEERFRSVLDSAPDAMVIVSRDGKIQMVNDQAEQLFGYKRKEMTGRNVAMLMPEAFRRRHSVHRAKYMAAPSSRPMGTGMVLFGRRKDGSEFPVEISLSPLETVNGLLVCSVVRDITERKKAEEAIQRLNAELEERVVARTAALQESNESLRQAIKDRSRLETEIIEISEAERRRIAQDLHDDLGQQLAGIWCLSDVLQQNLNAQRSPEAGSATRIAGYLRKSLALTRSLARGLHPVAAEPGGLLAALDELAVRSTELFKVRCTLACPKAVEIGDPAVATHIYRIAQEAVTNAVKHGSAKRIEIVLSASPNEAVLTVNDNGRGLQKTKAGHDGLGVRIMYYRAETLGGTLVFRNRPGGGTSVVCTIPTNDEPAPEKKRHDQENRG